MPPNQRHGRRHQRHVLHDGRAVARDAAPAADLRDALADGARPPMPHNMSAKVRTGRCEDDDDVIITTKNNSRLHILRSHYVAHHRHSDTERAGNATWDDDDRGIDVSTRATTQSAASRPTASYKICADARANATATFEWYVAYLGA